MNKEEVSIEGEHREFEVAEEMSFTCPRWTLDGLQCLASFGVSAGKGAWTVVTYRLETATPPPGGTPWRTPRPLRLTRSTTIKGHYINNIRISPLLEGREESEHHKRLKKTGFLN